ncbi:MAG: ribonuclease H-like domain-containing protein [Treponema sp.]|jgi:uncharacterized protein YprB with RNaseH-like and TPR domain|nr:ribonuclease H-like domain-containing protein [Treponema sp.]
MKEGLLQQRLRRIRQSGTEEGRFSSPASRSVKPQSGVSAEFGPEWREADFQTLKRSVTVDIAETLPEVFPSALPILIPDLFRHQRLTGRLPASDEFCFFDLETTGLSGGAGTVAFLAAAGRFTSSLQLQADQFLLLDYPGEAAFLERVLERLVPEASSLTIVTYNGKVFDVPLLRTRCLMNGIRPPEIFQADLLHPARGLWKNILPGCSQAVIETEILGLDRSGDINGAEAPGIWFDFLKTGKTQALMGICDHNIKDIAGLARLFAALADIAADPLSGMERYRFDPEGLALRWRKFLRVHRPFVCRESGFHKELHETAEKLLYAAGSRGSGKALLYLAMDAEWKNRDYVKALEYTETLLAMTEGAEDPLPGLERRRERLLGKLKAEQLF